MSMVIRRAAFLAASLALIGSASGHGTGVGNFQCQSIQPNVEPIEIQCRVVDGVIDENFGNGCSCPGNFVLIDSDFQPAAGLPLVVPPPQGASPG